jgi:hypothetical protein
MIVEMELRLSGCHGRNFATIRTKHDGNLAAQRCSRRVIAEDLSFGFYETAP